jgi:hypothetical protein
MNIEDMEALFNDDEMDEFLKFDRVENKRSKRPDLHAFMLLDELFPDDSDIVAAAAHDEIFLAPNPEELARVATKEQIVELIRCGVRLSDDSLAMFA